MIIERHKSGKPGQRSADLMAQMFGERAPAPHLIVPKRQLLTCVGDDAFQLAWGLEPDLNARYELTLTCGGVRHVAPNSELRTLREVRGGSIVGF